MSRWQSRRRDHRDEAFAACRHLIEELKRRVPIWKRETYADGSEAWVDPTAQGGSEERGTRRDGLVSDVIDTASFPLHRSRSGVSALFGSVTDRCNMRCRYCMPEESYTWLPRESMLTFEELDRLAGHLRRAGRAQGPPHRRRAAAAPRPAHAGPDAVGPPGLRDLALTTNGILLARHAAALRAAGLRRVTVSLDTLRPDRMLAFARSNRHRDVLEGIAAARAAGFGVKLNIVVIRGYNDDELTDLVEYGRAAGAEVRFIEYMDVGGATGWSMEQVS